MIELRTGIPGHGKTLSMVEALAKLIKRWTTHPEEARPIFVYGIPDLALPHCDLPLRQCQVKKDAPMIFVPDWDEMPDGSLVIIDEAQGFFPPRSSQSTPPVYVAWLNTHRHRGFDIWITTQHPKLIDSALRALVGKHQHYRRLFGRSRAVVYEFDGCNDNLSNLKSAVMSYWPYPKKVFGWYKSATIHTKQSFKLPRWLLVPAVGLCAAVYFVPAAFGTLSAGISGKGLSQASGSVTRQAVNDKAALAAAGVSRPDVSNDDGKKVPLTPFTRPVVLAAACIASATKCKCYSQEAVFVPLDDLTCRAAANQLVNFAL